MNSTISSFYSQNGYSIKILEIGNHLVSGLFTINEPKLDVPFTGLIKPITSTLHTLSFIIDWEAFPEGILSAQTAFNGYFKLNIPNPIIRLDWLMVQHFNYAPEVEFTTVGKSLLSNNYRPELDLQLQEDLFPYPRFNCTHEYLNTANTMVQRTII